MPGKLTLRVLDSKTMAPVASPTFEEMARPLVGICVGTPDAGAVVDGGDAGDAGDAGVSACPAWEFANLSVGQHNIQVGAPGYNQVPVAVTVLGPSGCCGTGPDVDKTVLLVK
jgi:hypothetical protein